MKRAPIELNRMLNPLFMNTRLKLIEDSSRQSENKYRQFIEKLEKENISLNKKIFQTVEEERHKISKDLHDGIGQTILAAKLNINIYKNNPKKHAERLEKALELLDGISREIREICYNLYPGILNESSLDSAIRRNVQNTLDACGFNTDINIKLNRNLPYNIAVNIYKIIQEIISNTIKHSKADTFILDLRCENECLILICEDNGIGFKKNKIKHGSAGFGLSNIRHRIESVGGILALDSEEGKGTKIKIVIMENFL
ncbi:MAG: ATP-binding protein [Spirochaetota bacterium]